MTQGADCGLGHAVSQATEFIDYYSSIFIYQCVTERWGKRRGVMTHALGRPLDCFGALAPRKDVSQRHAGVKRSL